ncbi:MAG: hypothetical protein LBK07_00830 [Tannerella sp.]|nr:hypothetical protein [Tannerella sp.]
MNRGPIPSTMKEFRDYIDVAYAKAEASAASYGIQPSRVNAIGPYYKDYTEKDDLANNPATATKANRTARNVASSELKTVWRQFLNECIRYNPLVGTADKEIFGITPRDGIRTPVQAPKEKGNVSAERLGMLEYEITVTDSKTTKRKLPEYATGSYIYLAVSDPGTEPEFPNAYRKQDFSSTARHRMIFTAADRMRQANVYARYANHHGQEGPAGSIETFIIS